MSDKLSGYMSDRMSDKMSVAMPECMSGNARPHTKISDGLPEKRLDNMCLFVK